MDQQDTPDVPEDSKISTEDGRQYWENIDADVNGMLGGFPYISKVDLVGSRAFLAKLGFGRKAGLKTVERALEGGAGIGRITKGLLLDIADEVDVIEPISKFTDGLKDVPGVAEVYNIGLEEWQPDEEISYDLIWIQWCVVHMTDVQLIDFLKRCISVLKRDEKGAVIGRIVVKENLTTSGKDMFDEVDSSVTRSDEKYRDLFEQAGLQIVRTELQRGFPKELFPVRSYALKPKSVG